KRGPRQVTRPSAVDPIWGEFSCRLGLSARCGCVTGSVTQAYSAKETTTEERLMARYAAGDQVAFMRVFALLAHAIRAFFLRSFSDDLSVAEDLTQTTFLKLHRARASYRPDLPLKSWVFTIAAGVRRDELRRRYRLPSHISEADLEQVEGETAYDPHSPQELDRGSQA